jgi:hypothetical protein
LSNGSVGNSGGVMFLPGDVTPRTVSTLSNLSLFRLIVAMCELVLFSMGEPEFRRGQRDCWPVSWAAFGVLVLRLETLAMVLELTATAAATSDCLWTAMLGRWSLQWASRVAMSPSRMTRMAARGEVAGGWRCGRRRWLGGAIPSCGGTRFRGGICGGLLLFFFFEFAWFCLNRGLTASGLLFS